LQLSQLSTGGSKKISWFIRLSNSFGPIYQNALSFNEWIFVDSITLFTWSFVHPGKTLPSSQISFLSVVNFCLKWISPSLVALRNVFVAHVQSWSLLCEILIIWDRTIYWSWREESLGPLFIRFNGIHLDA
jgi:hypothetical protein